MSLPPPLGTAPPTAKPEPPALAGEGCGGVGRGLCVPGEPPAPPQPLAEPDPDAPASGSPSAAAGLKAQASVPQPHPLPSGSQKTALAASCPCLPSPVPSGCWCGCSWASISAGLARLCPSVCARRACLPLPTGTGQPTGAQSAWHMKELTTFPSYPVPFFVLMTLGRAPCLPLPER